MHTLLPDWAPAVCVIVLFTFLPSTVLGQQDIRFSRSGEVDWSEWEVPVSDEQRRETLDTLAYEYTRAPPGAFREDVRFVDFSGDGRFDLIYNEYFGDVLDLVLLRQGKSRFEVVFDGYGRLSKMQRPAEGEPVTFQVHLPGCCADSRDFWTNYAPVWKNGALTYRVQHHAMIAGSDFDLPSTFFDKPVPVRLREPRARLRYRPIVNNDSTSLAGIPWAGNILAVYPTGTHGQALADTTDDAGRRWSFVMIPADSEPLSDPPVNLESFNETGRPSLLGWIPSDDLVRIQRQN